MYPAEKTLWTGYLEDIRPKVQHAAIPTALLLCSGALAWVGGRGSRAPTQTGAAPTVNSLGGPGGQIGAQLANATASLTGTVMNSILDDAGWNTSTDYRKIDAGQTTLRLFISDKPTLDAMRDVEASEHGFIWETASGQIAFMDRHGRLKGDYITPQSTYSDAPGAAIQYQAIEQQDQWAQIFNSVQVAVREYASGAAATLWTAPIIAKIKPPATI